MGMSLHIFQGPFQESLQLHWPLKSPFVQLPSSGQSCLRYRSTDDDPRGVKAELGDLLPTLLCNMEGGDPLVNNQLKPSQVLPWAYNRFSSNSSCSFCGFQKSLIHSRLLGCRTTVEELACKARFGDHPLPLQLERTGQL